jgi:hypothetical protein
VRSLESRDLKGVARFGAIVSRQLMGFVIDVFRAGWANSSGVVDCRLLGRSVVDCMDLTIRGGSGCCLHSRWR